MILPQRVLLYLCSCCSAIQMQTQKNKTKKVFRRPSPVIGPGPELSDSWLATICILDLTLRPSVARRRSRSSTGPPSGRLRHDKLPRAQPHARPVSFFAMRTHSLLDILYEVISRSSSRTLLASDITAPPSSGAPSCTLKACTCRARLRYACSGQISLPRLGFVASRSDS
jgi:hypothetical protein